MQKKYIVLFLYIWNNSIRASAFAMCCLASSSSSSSLLPPNARARTLKNSKWTDPLSSLRIQFLVRLTPASNKWMASQIYIHTQPPYILLRQLLLYYSSWHLLSCCITSPVYFLKNKSEKKFFFAAILLSLITSYIL